MVILVCVVIGGMKVAVGVGVAWPVWLWEGAWRAVCASKRFGSAETGMGVGVVASAGLGLGTTGVTRPRRANAELGVGFVADVLPAESWVVKGRWPERVLNGVLAWK